MSLDNEAYELLYGNPKVVPADRDEMGLPLAFYREQTRKALRGDRP